MKKFNFISSQFTRNRGYTNIKSSNKISHKNAISILNSFTPQGASPRISLRISSYQDFIGVGYYFMENSNNASISALLIPSFLDRMQILRVPLAEKDIKRIANGNKNSFHKINQTEVNQFEKLFGSIEFSSLIYSILAGDNIIIVHPNHNVRIKFIGNLLELLPRIIFNYNRITSGCAELEGNENIIGVAKLPSKFRSHKKLYLPVDTIFIDLTKGNIEGEGIKSCELTTRIGELYFDDKILAKNRIQSFFEEITKPNFQNNNYNLKTAKLISKIRSKLGFEEAQNENWLLSF